MPEQRLQRTRATLPSGYQFGDGRLGEMIDIALIARAYVALPLCALLTRRYDVDFSGASSFRAPVGLPSSAPQWRALHENAAEQLQREYVTGRDCGDERTT